MEPTPLTVEERERILSELHQREFLEQQAIAEQKKAKQEEAELHYRQSLAAEHSRRDSERREHISSLLKQSLEQLQKAIDSFEEGDESGCYRFLVKLDPSLISAQHRLIQSKAEGTVTGSLPTIRIKADNPLGFALINAEDFVPGIHETVEEMANEH